jgi:hypothetical protein
MNRFEVVVLKRKDLKEYAKDIPVPLLNSVHFEQHVQVKIKNLKVLIFEEEDGTPHFFRYTPTKYKSKLPAKRARKPYKKREVKTEPDQEQ